MRTCLPLSIFFGHVHRDEEVFGTEETGRTWSLPSPRRTLATKQRYSEGRCFPGKRHGRSFSSCVYLSWVLGTGLPTSPIPMTSWYWGGQTKDQLTACGFQGVLRLLCSQKLNLRYPYGATWSSCTGIGCVAHEVRPHHWDCCPNNNIVLSSQPWTKQHNNGN